jgi:uracil-DNA glycosylase family 4
VNSALHILTDELRRLKASGTKSVLVSEQSLVALRQAIRSGRGAEPARASAPPPELPEASHAAIEPSRTAVTVAKKAPAATEAVPFPSPTPFTLPAGDKATRMLALRERVRGDEVCRARIRPGKQIVVGVGSLDARIMFVGEAPGAEEEDRGEPFVGPAGQLLTKMIGAMGLTRADVYIGNIMNWRPEMPLDAGGVQYGNRPPTEGELRYCLPYLRAQIEIVDPAVLVALGTTAAQGLLGFGSFKALGEVRGRWSEFGSKPLMVTYHPSYILRNQSNRSKRMIWDDLLQVMARADLAISDKQRTFFLDK